MPSSLPPLELLRQDIDRIDDELHDLIMRRAAIVDEIRWVKPSGKAAIRPVREATILRRLLARHKGNLPKAVIVRLWQTMFAAFVGLQGEFIVVGPASLEMLAQECFGGSASYKKEEDQTTAISQVKAGVVTLALLSWPPAGGDWWHELTGGDAPRIIARLPFIDTAAGAIAVACLHPEPSGDDRSLVFVKTGAVLPFKDTRILVTDAGMDLVEVGSFIAPDDPRLGKAAGAILIGGYPAPYGGRS